MSEDEIRRVRRIVRDELYELLDVKFIDLLLQLVNGFESSIISFKQAISQGKSIKSKPEPKKEWGWNPGNIQWEESEGSKGKYERSEDINNLQFKLMLKNLQEHKGKLFRDGFFYWVFRNGATVGRKKQSQGSSHG